ALVIVAENLRALLRRVMGTITGRIFHTLTLTELPQPCLAGVSNTDTLQPAKIGNLADGRAIGFQIFHFRAGNLNRVDIQILLGGAYG
ncbi:MAG TPA: hypothetical protein VMF08_19840, partial [Candidatus Sulfotelmatobacter sp.]|nr:hypothetical protein [Candidatus Sulfotelmatobacter sp.]